MKRVFLAIGAGMFTFIFILFIGYMCNAPIIARDHMNFPAYFAGAVLGVLVGAFVWEASQRSIYR